MSEHRSHSKSQELNVGLIIAFLSIITICVTIGVGFWLSDILHISWLKIIFFCGSFGLVFVIAEKVSKYFGLDFLSKFSDYEGY